MVQLQDFSGLRRQEKVSFRLNGVNYHCAPELPGGVILDMATVREEIAEVLPDGVDSLQDIDQDDPEAGAKLATAGGSAFTRMDEFIRTVMEPDSYEKWQLYLRPPAKGLSPAKRREHDQRTINLAQMTSVFDALLKHYTGRPTGPSSTSSNGDGGTGGSSTADAQVGA